MQRRYRVLGRLYFPSVCYEREGQNELGFSESVHFLQSLYINKPRSLHVVNLTITIAHGEKLVGRLYHIDHGCSNKNLRFLVYACIFFFSELQCLLRGNPKTFAANTRIRFLATNSLDISSFVLN